MSCPPKGRGWASSSRRRSRPVFASSPAVASSTTFRARSSWTEYRLGTFRMNPILIDLPIHEEHLRRLEALPETRVQVIAPSEDARVLPADLLHDKRILLCTTPP